MDRLFAFQNRSDTLQLYGCHFGLKPAGWSYDKHHHHLYELFCCMDGFAVQEMQGSSVPLAPGDWFLLRPGVSHTLTNAGPGPLAFFNFHFDLDDLEVRGRLGAAPFRLIPGRLAAGSGLPGCVAGLESLLGKQLISDSDPACPADAPRSHAIPLGLHQQLAFQSAILAILGEVIRLLEEIPQPSGHHGLTASAYELDIAHAAEKRLTADWSESPSVSAIAAEMGISRSQLCRIFVHVYGLSPRQYLTRRKWSKAKELLAISNLNVYTVSEQLGFRSVHHFSRQFRRWTGLTPSQYRKQEREGAGS
ncbi:MULTISPECIES: AraC family transcriptional regulator [unclassified Paenibacillus]|uniref:helix-turn-helix transcriptional regulator n=1 Tax=unclassified Paenibacillus TaxID=185978 RepID=UPI000953D540|nr:MULTISPECIES: AraC family transcriptional regulator [unclassified Paenibacillus]ASS66952.2 AraC family transcriptional regulator [Paenibacillus sp. RUD330]SIR51152.1 AraC-type DNA-binding protein [Paenibacillus sp. RU4X]SIR60111.1 AraC-type DNA-binding protein [Paenibacillus sp. RU4T]